METKKRILVACGSAIAVSSVVAKAIEEALDKRGISATITQCKASEVPNFAQDADLIVTTTPVATDHGKQIIQTLAFITGIGKEAVIEQIINKLNCSSSFKGPSEVDCRHDQQSQRLLTTG